MNPENPMATQVAGPPRPPTTTQTYLATPPGQQILARAVATLPTTSTYLSPPWAFSAFRHGPSEQLVHLAALSVILAALVAIAGILGLVAILVLRAL